MTKALALELATEGVTVVGISPGPFATEMNAPLINDPIKNAQFLDSIPVHRWGKVEDIGALAALSLLRRGFVHHRHRHRHRRRLAGALGRRSQCYPIVGR